MKYIPDRIDLWDLDNFYGADGSDFLYFIIFLMFFTDELSSWIQQSFKHYVTQEAKQHFSDYDKDGDGLVSWKEYNLQMYDRVIDFDEDTVLEDQEEESFRQVKCFSSSSCELLAKGSCICLLWQSKMGREKRAAGICLTLCAS